MAILGALYAKTWGMCGVQYARNSEIMCLVLCLDKSKCGLCVSEKRQNDVMHAKHERMCGENVAQTRKTTYGIVAM